MDKIINLETNSNIPLQLQMAIKYLYNPLGMIIKDIFMEAESEEYNAYRLSINGKKVIFRTGKTTPTKYGQFVTIWKRPNKKTMPFDSADDFDFIIIGVNENDNYGQFIFSKEVLIKEKIISDDKNIGKMGIRIYPPWVTLKSAQAIKTQKWQTKYYVSIVSNNKIDIEKEKLINILKL